MRRIALIGGTGSHALLPPVTTPVEPPITAWGRPAAELLHWRRDGLQFWFLPRHGPDGGIPPHLVDYRANVASIAALAPDAVIGLNAVGGISADATPGRLVLPSQLIDYTWGRAQSFSDGTRGPLRHVEFDPPFDDVLRTALAAAGASRGIDLLSAGTYGVTQGPRLETAAEIDRLARDGCDVVGMTAMPEAVLAREAGLPYAIIAVVVNLAAGRLPAGRSIHADMGEYLQVGMTRAARLLDALTAPTD